MGEQSAQEIQHI